MEENFEPPQQPQEPKSNFMAYLLVLVFISIIIIVGIYFWPESKIERDAPETDEITELLESAIGVDEIEIGTPKEEFFEAFPNSEKFEGTGFAIGMNFIEEFDFGPDCWTVEGDSFTCFKEDKVFVLAQQGGLGILIDDRREDLLYSLDYSDPNTCETLDELPFYVGYLDKAGCYEFVAITTKDVEICRLVTKARLQDPSVTEATHDRYCFSELLQLTKDPDLCDAIELKDDRDYCFDRAADWFSDPSLCENIESPSKAEKCLNSAKQ